MSELNLDQLENLAIRASIWKLTETGGTPFAHVPEGTKIESLERFNPHPDRVTRRLAVTTLESFVSYFNEFKEPESKIYADLAAVSVVGIMDDHSSIPRWESHRVTYACPFSRQWKAWAAMDRHKLSQVDFAEWLEDRTSDVQTPPGGDLLDLCTHLQIHRKVAYGSATRLATGETAFSYSEGNEAGTVEIPAAIVLGIPVFERGTTYAITARLRYRLSDGNLQLWYQLIEPERYIEDAFAEVVQAVEAGTGKQPFDAVVGSLT